MSSQGSTPSASRSLARSRRSFAPSMSRKASLHHMQSYGSASWSVDDSSCFPDDLDHYDLQGVCGKGASALVWKAYCSSAEQAVAIKVINLELFGANMDIVMQEAMIMRQQRHGNVLPLYTAFLHEHNLHMVMPYVAGGSAAQIMNKHSPQGFEPLIVATIAKAVLEGLNYLHQRGCIHRDLKGDNILIEKSGHVVLADFGVTAMMETAEDTCRRVSSGSLGTASESVDARDSAQAHHCYLARHTFVGTPSHMAPEVMEQDGYYQTADIWAFGILLIELARGRAPYSNFSLTNIIMMTLHGEPPALDVKECPCEPLRDIVAKCLVHNAKERPTAAQLLKHRFFKMAKDDSWLRQALFSSQADADATTGSVHGSMHGSMRRNASSSMLSKSINYSSLNASLSQDASRAASTLRYAASRKRQACGTRLQPDSLLTCKAVAFMQVLPMRKSYAGLGNGFLCTRLSAGDEKTATWSAPVYFDMIIPNATVEYRHIECCFVIPDDMTLEAFVRSKPALGTDGPVARDVELGLASRGQVLQVLNKTLVGNLQQAASSDRSQHGPGSSSSTLMDAFNHADAIEAAQQYGKENRQALGQKAGSSTAGQQASAKPASLHGIAIPCSPFESTASEMPPPGMFVMPGLAVSEQSSTAGSVHDWSPSHAQMPRPPASTIPESRPCSQQDHPQRPLFPHVSSQLLRDSPSQQPPPFISAVAQDLRAQRKAQQGSTAQASAGAEGSQPPAPGGMEPDAAREPAQQQLLFPEAASGGSPPRAPPPPSPSAEAFSPLLFPEAASGGSPPRAPPPPSPSAEAFSPLLFPEAQQQQQSSPAAEPPAQQLLFPQVRGRQEAGERARPPGLPLTRPAGERPSPQQQADSRLQRSASHDSSVAALPAGCRDSGLLFPEVSRPLGDPDRRGSHSSGALESRASGGSPGSGMERQHSSKLVRMLKSSGKSSLQRQPSSSVKPASRRRPSRDQPEPLQAPPRPQLPVMYAYGVAEPYLMASPCTMGLKYGRVTINVDYNSRLYGGRTIQQVLDGNVPVPPAMGTFHSALNRVYEKGTFPSKQKAWYTRVLHSLH